MVPWAMPSRCPAPFSLQRDVQLPRQVFVARFLARMTRRAADRDLVSGQRLRCKGGLWIIDMPEVGGELARSRSEEGIYDYARRGALGYYVRQADALWEEARTT